MSSMATREFFEDPQVDLETFVMLANSPPTPFIIHWATPTWSTSTGSSTFPIIYGSDEIVAVYAMVTPTTTIDVLPWITEWHRVAVMLQSMRLHRTELKRAKIYNDHLSCLLHRACRQRSNRLTDTDTNREIKTILNSLPTVHDLYGAGSCSVCLQNYLPDDFVVVLDCHTTHHLHRNCLRAWLASSSTCPICRTPISSPIDNLY